MLVNVDPPFATSAQHQPNVGSTCAACLEDVRDATITVRFIVWYKSVDGGWQVDGGWSVSHTSVVYYQVSAPYMQISLIVSKIFGSLIYIQNGGDSDVEM